MLDRPTDDDMGPCSCTTRRARRLSSLPFPLPFAAIALCVLVLASQCCVPVRGQNDRLYRGVGGPPPSVDVGVMLSVTVPSSPPFDPAAPLPPESYTSLDVGAWVASKFQAGVINARSDLLPHTRLIVRLYDDQYSSWRGTDGVLRFVAEGAVAILGAGTSASSTTAEYVARHYDMPLLSAAASSPSLANKKDAPQFARICQNDAEQGRAMAELARRLFGWNEAAIIYTSDPYGRFGAATFASAAGQLNLTIQAQQQIPASSSEEEVEIPLANLRAIKARIICFFGQAQDFESIVQVGQRYDMFNNKTVWFVSDAVSSSEAFNRKFQDSLRGLISVVPYAGNDRPPFQQWAAQFLSRPIDPADPLAERYDNQDPNAISAYSVFAADAMTVIATALHDVIYTQGMNSSFTPSDVWRSLQRVSLQGISGPVSFDANLDRVGLGFRLRNLRAGGWKSVGSIIDGEYTPIEGAGLVVWADGTTNVPRSRDPDPLPIPPFTSILSTQAYVTLLVLSSGMLALIAVLFVLLFRFRTTRVLHAASPIMLAIVLLGGTGVSLSALLSAFPQEPALCTARVWLFNLGFVLAFCTLFLKTYRVHKIFSNSKLVLFTFGDGVVLRLLSLCLLFDVCLLALRTGLSPYHLDEHQVCTFADRQSQIANVLTLLLLASKAFVVAAAAYLAFRVRHLPQLFHESTYISIAIYTILLLCSGWIFAKYTANFRDNPQLDTLLDAAMMLVCTFVTLMLLFAPKMWDVYAAQKQAAFQAAMRKRAGKIKMHQLHAVVADMPSPPHSAQWGSAGNGNANGSAQSGESVSLPSVSAILQLLQQLQADTSRRIERLLGEIRRAHDSIATKQAEAEAYTDVLFQLGWEIAYFERVAHSGISESEIYALFERRLKDFGVQQLVPPPIASPAGSPPDDEPQADPAAAAAGGGAGVSWVGELELAEARKVDPGGGGCTSSILADHSLRAHAMRQAGGKLFPAHPQPHAQALTESAAKRPKASVSSRSMSGRISPQLESKAMPSPSPSPSRSGSRSPRPAASAEAQLHAHDAQSLADASASGRSVHLHIEVQPPRFNGGSRTPSPRACPPSTLQVGGRTGTAPPSPLTAAMNEGRSTPTRWNIGAGMGLNLGLGLTDLASVTSLSLTTESPLLRAHGSDGSADTPFDRRLLHMLAPLASTATPPTSLDPAAATPASVPVRMAVRAAQSLAVGSLQPSLRDRDRDRGHSLEAPTPAPSPLSPSPAFSPQHSPAPPPSLMPSPIQTPHPSRATTPLHNQMHEE